MRSFVRAGAIALAMVGAVSLGGCQSGQSFGDWFSGVSSKLDVFNQKVTQYAPVVGKDLIAFANIIYQVECSPATPVVGQAASNILQVFAPNSTAADKFQTRVEQNDDIARQLCPLVAAIEIDVAKVPQTATPTQVIAPAASGS